LRPPLIFAALTTKSATMAHSVKEHPPALLSTACRVRSRRSTARGPFLVHGRVANCSDGAHFCELVEPFEWNPGRMSRPRSLSQFQVEFPDERADGSLARDCASSRRCTAAGWAMRAELALSAADRGARRAIDAGSLAPSVYGSERYNI
jgi:hypothetical protein